METTEQEKMHSLYFKERTGLEYPTRRSNTIEPGVIYRSRAGDRIKVYAVEGKELHGAILHKGNWEVDTWYRDGKYMSGKGKDHPRDIILAPPLVLKPGNKYKSRDGRPIEVYAVNKGSEDHPIIGAIKDEKGHWLPRIWNDKGTCKIPYGPNNDIVAAWSET